MMTIDLVSRALTSAFIAAIETLEDADLKQRRGDINKVALLSFETGLCRLSTKTCVDFSWRLIPQDDIKCLRDAGESLEPCQLLLTTIANKMLMSPSVALCQCPLPVDATLLAQSFWKKGHAVGCFEDVEVLGVLTDIDSPQIRDPKGPKELSQVCFFMHIVPENEARVSVSIRQFLAVACFASVFMATRTEVEAIPLECLSEVSGEMLVKRFYFLNVDRNFDLIQPECTSNTQIIDLRSAAPEASKETIITQMPDALHSELARRVNDASFVDQATRWLSILPHGQYLLEAVNRTFKDKRERDADVIKIITEALGNL